MKSQHRHDLQTNELGRFAERFVAACNEFYTSHGNQLMIGVVVVALAASALIFSTRKSRQAEAEAWAALANASQAEAFAKVADKHAGTDAARWARVHEGEFRLNEGVQLAFTNVESADRELKLARKALQMVVDEKGAPAEVRERALFGLALSLESMSTGNEAEAVKTYEALLREFPATIYKKEAESRIAALGSANGQEFYGWFASFPRPKPTEKRPHDRMIDNLNLDDPLDLQDESGDSKPAGKDRSAKADASDAETPEKAGDKTAVDDLPAPERKPDQPPADKLPQ